MKVIITGGGDVGTELAKVLISEKHDVVVVESDGKRADELAESLDALVLKGDASDRRVLKDAGIEKCDAFLALTSDDKTNLLVCEIAKSFGVPKIVARVSDPSNEQIFSQMGITAAVNTISVAVTAFKRILEGPDERLLCLAAGNRIKIMERTVSRKSRACGKKVKDLGNGFVVAAIVRDGEFLKPEGNRKLSEGDSVIVCAPVEEDKEIERVF